MAVLAELTVVRVSFGARRRPRYKAHGQRMAKADQVEHLIDNQDGRSAAATVRERPVPPKG
jgi:hypothetical protein